MKTKRNDRKLSLNKQTVSNLAVASMKLLNGGGPIIDDKVPDFLSDTCDSNCGCSAIPVYTCAVTCNVTCLNTCANTCDDYTCGLVETCTPTCHVLGGG